MSSVIYFVSCLVILFGGMLVTCNGQEEDGQPDNGQRAGSTPRRTEGLDPDLHRAYVNAFADVSQQTTTTLTNLWERLAPRLPSPNEVDCYVEVVRITRRGGRCTRLGGYSSKPFICQSGPYFEFQSVCEQIMANRNAQPRAEPQE